MFVLSLFLLQAGGRYGRHHLSRWPRRGCAGDLILFGATLRESVNDFDD